jgi:hypothetical protein
LRRFLDRNFKQETAVVEKQIAATDNLLVVVIIDKAGKKVKFRKGER